MTAYTALLLTLAAATVACCGLLVVLARRDRRRGRRRGRSRAAPITELTNRRLMARYLHHTLRAAEMDAELRARREAAALVRLAEAETRNAAKEGL